MTFHAALFARLAVLACAVLFSASVSAQATRTWVSGVGDDANPCSRTAPCKTFAGAISKTATGGTINVLDPGGYGAVSIGKAITIDGRGQHASILASGTNGVLINAAAGAVVVLRNLSIVGAGTGINGVRFIGGGALHMQNVDVDGFTGAAIDFEPVGASELHVTGGTLSRAGHGVLISPGVSGTAIASLDGVSVIGNGGGVRAEKGSMVSIDRSVISDNTNAGVGAVASSGVAQVTVRSSLLSGNNPSSNPASAAVKASGAAATINLDGSTIVNNGIGLIAANGSAIVSTGRNRVAGNDTDGSPTATVPTL